MPSTSEHGSGIIVERQGSLGRIRLNRPKALNSLTLEMVDEIDRALDAFQADASITSVLVSGEGERGLCAGGDIRTIYDALGQKNSLPQIFWHAEYRLNARISHYPKPYIAFMDGIVMGGGVGISVHGSHRIVTERTKFAMPETGIGFFPDVGASWFLTRQQGECGTYLALTGEVIGAGDAIALGLADGFVSASRLEEFTGALAAITPGKSPSDLSDLVDSFSEPLPSGVVWPLRETIDRLFAFDTIEGILTALDRDGSEFAANTAATLRARPPTSLKVTLRLLRLGRRAKSLEECLEREFAATPAVAEGCDFREGVRAAVIDKDRNPHWQPATLRDVTSADMAAYFPAEHPKLFAG